MSLEDLLARLVPSLERAEVPYMLTGSIASSAHGIPRSTRDLDIVIAPTRSQLLALIQQFPTASYYADEQQALTALDHRSQFNIIDLATGWKVDFIIAEETEYARTAFARRRHIEIAGHTLYVASPEDVIIAKMRWAQLGGSELQLQDAAGVLHTQGPTLDSDYVGHWVRQLGLDNQWQQVRQISQ